MSTETSDTSGSSYTSDIAETSETSDGSHRERSSYTGSSSYTSDGSEGSSCTQFHDDLIEITLEGRRQRREQKQGMKKKPPLKRSRYMENIFNAILGTHHTTPHTTHILFEKN